MLVLGALAASADGRAEVPVAFSHGDWMLVCDNTGTCRAAGYQAEADPEGVVNVPVSVLLTRAAGAGTRVSGQLLLGHDWSDDAPNPLPAEVALHVDGRVHGRIPIAGNEGGAPLSAAQVATLLAALRRDSRIEFRAIGGAEVWRLSDAGASAVLLKMDDAQGRVGTVGALVRRGQADESAVPAATPEPIVRAVGAAPAQPGDDDVATRHGPAIHAALRAADPAQDCVDLHEPRRLRNGDAQALVVHRLDAERLLVESPCWLAAYNEGRAFWIVNDAPPFRATLAAEGNGLRIDATLIEISASNKGRGVGDCWSHETFTWDGARFLRTASGDTGLCRGFPGGAWSLPNWVSKVVAASPAS